MSDWRDYLDEVDPEDFELLYALHQVEPWGEARADLRTAWLIEAIAATQGQELRLEPEALDYLGLRDEDEYATHDDILRALGG